VYSGDEQERNESAHGICEFMNSINKLDELEAQDTLNNME
jgi:hypothetical protein